MSLGNGAPHLDGNSFRGMQAERRPWPIAIPPTRLAHERHSPLVRVVRWHEGMVSVRLGRLGGVLWASLRTLSDEVSSRARANHGAFRPPEETRLPLTRRLPGLTLVSRKSAPRRYRPQYCGWL